MGGWELRAPVSQSVSQSVKKKWAEGRSPLPLKRVHWEKLRLPMKKGGPNGEGVGVCNL